MRAFCGRAAPGAVFVAWRQLHRREQRPNSLSSIRTGTNSAWTKCTTDKALTSSRPSAVCSRPDDVPTSPDQRTLSPLLNASRAPLSVRDAHSHARTLRPSATHGRVDTSETFSGSRVLAAARRCIHNVRHGLASAPVFLDISVEVSYFLFYFSPYWLRWTSVNVNRSLA